MSNISICLFYACRKCVFLYYSKKIFQKDLLKNVLKVVSCKQL